MRSFKILMLYFVLLQGVLMANQKIHHIEIDNKENVLIFEEDRKLPIISMQLVIADAGSTKDKVYPGIANFLSKIFMEGSKTLGSKKFAQALEERAINFGVSAGFETMTFKLSSLKDEFEFGLSMLESVIATPNFTDESFSQVKARILGTISSKTSDFDYVASNELYRLLYEGTPLGQSSIGTKESIEKLSLSTLGAFYKDYIDRSNAIVVIGGDLSLEEAKVYASRILKTLKVGKKRKSTIYPLIGSSKTSTIQKDTEQAYIYFGSPLYIQNTDPEEYKLKVAGFILGESGFGSRIMEEIRVKRGLAYSAYGRFTTTKSYSHFTGYLQTKLENQDEAIKIIKEVMEDFVKNGVTQEELDQAKRFLLGSEPLRNETLSQRLARAFSEHYNGFELGYTKHQLEAIEELDLHSLNEFIASHPEILKLTFSIVTK